MAVAHHSVYIYMCYCKMTILLLISTVDIYIHPIILSEYHMITIVIWLNRTYQMDCQSRYQRCWFPASILSERANLHCTFSARVKLEQFPENSVLANDPFSGQNISNGGNQDSFILPAGTPFWESPWTGRDYDSWEEVSMYLVFTIHRVLIGPLEERSVF